MARITLDEVRTLVRSDPNYAKWRKGEDTNLYVLIGPAEGRTDFHSETHGCRRPRGHLRHRQKGSATRDRIPVGLAYCFKKSESARSSASSGVGVSHIGSRRRRDRRLRPSTLLGPESTDAQQVSRSVRGAISRRQ